MDHPLEHDKFWLTVLSLGYVRDIVHNKGLDIGLGSMVTVNKNPPTLTPVYGATKHGGWQVFLRLRPSRIDY